MKKMLFLIFAVTLCLSHLAFAEDVYCGDYNGKPAYLKTESIDKHLAREDGNYSVYTDKNTISVYPEYGKYYSAHLIIEENLYEVCFSESTEKSFSVIKILKGHQQEIMNNMDLSFAYNTAISYYDPDKFKMKDEYMRKFNAQKDKEQNTPYQKQRLKDSLAQAIDGYRYYTKTRLQSSADSEAKEIKRLSGFFSEDELTNIADEFKLTKEEKLLLIQK